MISQKLIWKLQKRRLLKKPRRLLLQQHYLLNKNKLNKNKNKDWLSQQLLLKPRNKRGWRCIKKAKRQESFLTSLLIHPNWR